MFPHVLTVDTAAGLSLVEETVLMPTMQRRIEPCSGVTLRFTSNTRVQLLGQIRLYICLHDLLFPFYFGVMRNFPPKLFMGTTFCDRHIVTIKPVLKQMTPKNSGPLPILAFNDDTVSAIHTPQPLTPHITTKERVNPRLTTTTTVEPYSKQIVPVNAPVDGLFTMETHPNL